MKKEKKKKKKREGKGKGRGKDPMTGVLATFKDPKKSGFEDAWCGLEPTFQTAKSIEKWAKYASQGEAGEDAYFEDRYLLEMQVDVAKAIVKRYRARREEGAPECMFASVEREEDRDQWDVQRQVLHFHWDDDALPDFEAKWTLDPETFEWSIKPVPIAWLYDDRFVDFLQTFMWDVPMSFGLSPSMAHGGGQFSLSAKTFLTGSLLADDIATRLNHPELATWTNDWPNCDARSFRATQRRAQAFRDLLERYREGAFHPRAIGAITPEHCYLERGFGPARRVPAGLVDASGAPVGDPREVFQTNFALARALRLQAQAVHPGYWQAQGYKAEGYRPDQIMRYSEGNLNRLQIAGEPHVKSGKMLEAERVPELEAPLDPSMLTDEASWENRAQMSKSSARDMVEAVLLDVHHAKWLSAHPGVQVIDDLAQDQLLCDSIATLEQHGGARVLARLKKEAREANLETSNGRVRSDWIEPEALFWAAWRVLPVPEQVRVAREAVGNYVRRVEEAASVDPRPEARKDPMAWHRHRVHPLLWKALAGAKLREGDPVARELARWEAGKQVYLSRRPVWSQTGGTPPWKG